MKSSKSSLQPSYVTLNKDGKAVWEPGLGPEVVRRRHPAKKKAEEPTEVPISCDVKTTLKLDPPERAKWLERALEAIPKGKVKSQDVFDVITHRKFVSGVADDLGPKMIRLVKESLMFFSEKQQLNIAKCKLVREFKPSESSSRRKRRHDDDSDSDDRSSDDEPGGRRFQEDKRDEDRRGDSPAPPTEAASMLPPMPNVSPEERARLEREYLEKEAERAKKKEEELKRVEAERKAQAERERARKQKIGNAFLMGNEDEEEPRIQVRHPLVEKRYEDRLRPSEPEETLGHYKATSSTSTIVTAASAGAIHTMGGDAVVNEAQEILKQGAGVFLNVASRRRSRSRRRRSSSSSAPRKKDKRDDKTFKDRRDDPVRRQRVYSSNRSPTPDGHLRGQMRAARKAKMMAQMLQQGNVPRVA